MNKEELKELAATLNGIADGKEWECVLRDGSYFSPVPGMSAWEAIRSSYGIRLKPWQLPQPPDGMQWHRDDFTQDDLIDYRPLLLNEEREPGDWCFSQNEWHLVQELWVMHPAHGKTNKHRTKRPLPQPQRPDPYAELKAAHAAGKVIQFRYATSDGFSSWRDDEASIPAFGCEGYEFRIKPEQQKVPLGPGDVPPGTVLRGAGEASDPAHQGWCMITSSSVWGIRTWRHCDPDYQHEITWRTLMDAESQIWRPTDTSWQPCYKLIDTP